MWGFMVIPNVNSHTVDIENAVANQGQRSALAIELRNQIEYKI
jgi:hypothetical protein